MMRIPREGKNRQIRNSNTRFELCTAKSSAVFPFWWREEVGTKMIKFIIRGGWAILLCLLTSHVHIGTANGASTAMDRADGAALSDQQQPSNGLWFKRVAAAATADPTQPTSAQAKPDSSSLPFTFSGHFQK